MDCYALWQLGNQWTIPRPRTSYRTHPHSIPPSRTTGTRRSQGRHGPRGVGPPGKALEVGPNCMARSGIMRQQPKTDARKRAVKSTVTFVVAMLSLAGCGRTVYVTGRTSGVSGQTTVTPAGRSSGDITLSLGARVYTGRWVYVSGPGSVSVSSATAFSGAHSASASGIGFGLPTSGRGSIVMSAAGGGSLRCAFDYSEWSSTGIGECQDETGAMYDLQITR